MFREADMYITVDEQT
jgi:hypothetical protein